MLLLSHPNRQPQERKLHHLPPEEHQQLVGRSSCPPSVRGEESLPRTMPIKARPLAVIPKAAFRGQQEPLSRQSSMASVAGSTASDHLPRKPFHQTKASQSEVSSQEACETAAGLPALQDTSTGLPQVQPGLVCDAGSCLTVHCPIRQQVPQREQNDSVGV